MTHACPTRRPSDLMEAALCGAPAASTTNAEGAIPAPDTQPTCGASPIGASVRLVATQIRWAPRRQNSRTQPSATGPEPNTTGDERSEEHTSELQSLMRLSYDVLCLKKKTKK